MRHRFLPRFGALATVTAVLGVLLCAAAVAGLLPADMRLIGVVAGTIGAALGLGYRLSPSWRLEVITDDEGLEVLRGHDSRFRLAWQDVQSVTASPTTHTCFVDGGSPERSLLVPGFGAPASYDLSDKAALFNTIVSAVPKERITEVESLDGVEH